MSEENVKNLKIIVADDNEAILFLYKVMFNKVSNNCTYVVSGQEVLDRLNENFDMIFLDYEMPEMNGLETALKIREINKDVIIIAVTGHNISSLSQKDNEVFNDMITKPIKIDKIREYICKFFP